MNWKKLGLAAVIGMSLTALVAGCGGDASKPAAGGSAADTQGNVTVYTSQPEGDVQKLIAGFNKKYPNIKVSVFRSGTEEVISKVKAEKQINDVQADVLLVADAVTFEDLKKLDMLQSYKSAELTGIDPQYIDKDNTFVGTKVIATGIAYNTDKVQQAPASFMDLTKPEFSGQLIMPSPLYSGAAAYNLGVITRTPSMGWDFYRALKANNITVDKGNGAVLKALSDGTKEAGILVDFMAIRAQAKGAKVAFVYPSEGALVITEPIGILKNSKHDKEAKLFEDFVLSEDGQKLASEMGYTPIKEGVPAPKGMKSVKEIKALSANLDELLANRDKDKQEFSQLFQ